MSTYIANSLFFPDDLIECVLLFLEWNEILTMGETCTGLYDFCNNYGQLWKKLVKRDLMLKDDKKYMIFMKQNEKLSWQDFYFKSQIYHINRTTEFCKNIGNVIRNEKYDKIYDKILEYKMINFRLLLDIISQNGRYDIVYSHPDDDEDYDPYYYDDQEHLLYYDGKKCIAELFKKNKIIKYIIDNAIYVEYTKGIYVKYNYCSNEYTWWKYIPIHIICRFGTPELLKYIIKKNVNLEYKDIFGNRPIHIICQYGTLEMLKCLVECDVDLECANHEKLLPVHILCKSRSMEMIKCIIDAIGRSDNGKKYPYLACTKKNSKYNKYDKYFPINYICKYGTIELLKIYLIKYNVKILYETHVEIKCMETIGHILNNLFEYESLEDLKKEVIKYIKSNCTRIKGSEIIPDICKYKTLELLEKYLAKNGVELTFTKKYPHLACTKERQIELLHNIYEYGTLELLKYLIETGIEALCKHHNFNPIWRYGKEQTLRHLIKNNIVPIKVLKHTGKPRWLERQIIIMGKASPHLATSCRKLKY